MQTQQAVEPTVIDPEAVAAFYKRRPRTDEEVRQTGRIMQEEFTEIQSITRQAVREPEEEAECIRVTVTARLKGADLRAAYLRCVDRRITETPAELRHFVTLLRFGV